MSHCIFSPAFDFVIRVNSWDPPLIYAALDAFDCYGGVSGNGNCKIVHKETLLRRMKLIRHPKYRNCDFQYTFLEECLKHMDENGQIEVCFC